MSEAQYLNKLVRICKKYAFPWPDIITQATNKDNWVIEVDVLAAIKTFNQEHLLSAVTWTQPPDPFTINHEIKKICFDIASAGNSSLFTSDM